MAENAFDIPPCYTELQEAPTKPTFFIQVERGGVINLNVNTSDEDPEDPKEPEGLRPGLPPIYDNQIPANTNGLDAFLHRVYRDYVEHVGQGTLDENRFKSMLWFAMTSERARAMDIVRTINRCYFEDSESSEAFNEIKRMIPDNRMGVYLTGPEATSILHG